MPLESDNLRELIVNRLWPHINQEKDFKQDSHLYRRNIALEDDKLTVLETEENPDSIYNNQETNNQYSLSESDSEIPDHSIFSLIPKPSIKKLMDKALIVRRGGRKVGGYYIHS